MFLLIEYNLTPLGFEKWEKFESEHRAAIH